MIKRKRTLFTVLTVTLLYIFAYICRMSQLSGLTVPAFLLKSWEEQPYSMFCETVWAVICGSLTAFVLWLITEYVSEKDAGTDTVKAAESEKYDEGTSEKMTSPLCKGFVSSDAPSASDIVFGRYEGKQICAPASISKDGYRSLYDGNFIALFGSDNMRKISGLIAPMIFRMIDFGSNLFIADTAKSELFRILYPYLRYQNAKVRVLDLRNPGKTGINILASAGSAENRDMLARLLASGQNTGRRPPLTLVFTLKSLFTYATEKKDATFLSAYSALAKEDPDADEVFGPKDVFFWSDVPPSVKKRIETEWDRIADQAKRILRPYANASYLNQGMTPDEFCEDILTQGPITAFFFRPATGDSPVSAINSYIFWCYANKAENIAWSLPRTSFQDPLTFINASDIPMHNACNMKGYVDEGKRHNIRYVMNIIQADENSVASIRTGKSVFNCANYCVISGTVNRDTAGLLAEIAGEYPCGKNASMPYTSSEELESITKDEVYVIGSPARYARIKESGPGTPSDPGLYRLTKLYYKEHAYADAMIIMPDTGEAKKLSIEDFDKDKEADYEVIPSSEVRLRKQQQKLKNNDI